jgi:divalent metal cation (Fe/Co/Zn/Cd) transporter
LHQLLKTTLKLLLLVAATLDLPPLVLLCSAMLAEAVHSLVDIANQVRCS